jgi:hypothetical protein
VFIVVHVDISAQVHAMAQELTSFHVQIVLQVDISVQVHVLV